MKKKQLERPHSEFPHVFQRNISNNYFFSILSNAAMSVFGVSLFVIEENDFRRYCTKNSLMCLLVIYLLPFKCCYRFVELKDVGREKYPNLFCECDSSM